VDRSEPDTQTIIAREQGASGRDCRLALFFSALVALLALNTLLAVRSIQSLEDREQAVIHSQMVLAAIDAVQTALVDAETGQRGYILTGDTTYLAPDLTARQTLGGDVDALSELTADEPAQQARIATLKPLIADRLTLLDQAIQMRKKGQTDAALQLVASGKGLRDMDAIGGLLGQMDTAEDALLTQRSANAHASLTQATITILIAVMADAVLLAAVYLLIRRALVRREEVARERARLLDNEHEARRAAEAAVQVRDRFLAIASHELNTPLTTIKALAEYLSNRLLAVTASKNGAEGAARGQTEANAVAANASESAELLRIAVGRLERLVSEMLDASRIESGHLPLRLERGDLGALCRQVGAEQQMTGRDVRVQAPEEPVLVEMDEGRVAQVLANVLGNARKFSPTDRPVVLNLRCDAGEAVCCVRDEGPGIAPDELGHIFERYYCAPSVAVQTGSQMGLGLGLYVCREIMERQGGRMWAESMPGAGSRFYIALPAAMPDAAYVETPRVKEGEAYGARAGRG
jgi:signal transduction histidine kinase